MSFKYTGLLLFVLLFNVLSWVVCETTFDCFHDRCVRGQMYCVTERERCYKCSDRISDCGSDRLPRDCDAYCERRNLEFTVKSLNGTIRELLAQNHQLNESSVVNKVLILTLQSRLNTTRTGSANLRLEMTEITKNLTDVISRLNVTERERDYLVLMQKGQEYVNRTYRQRLKYIEEEKAMLQNENYKYLCSVGVLSTLLVTSIAVNAFLCVRYVRPYCRRKDIHLSAMEPEHQPELMETRVPLINETQQNPQQRPHPQPQPQPRDHPQLRPEALLQSEPKPERGANDAAVNTIHIDVTVYNESNPGEDKSDKRNSQDSGVNSDTSSGSTSSINEDGQSKDGNDESSHLHPTDVSEGQSAETTEMRCDCILTHKGGVRRCYCKCNSQMPPTHGVSKEKTALLPSSFHPNILS